MSFRSEILSGSFMRSRVSALESKSRLYESVTLRDEIEKIQVDRFNRTWTEALQLIPFYRDWQLEHRLPSCITRPSDLLDFPPLTKADISANRSQIFGDSRITGYYTTGGSTGEPTRYPRGPGELEQHWVNSFVARSWSGIRPFGRCVHLWGHSHLFGSGLKGQLQQVSRRGKDAVFGFTRLDAYDLSAEAQGRNYEALIRVRPTVLSGYASAVVRLARFIQTNSLPLKSSRLHAVVLCAETVDDEDLRVVDEIFGARTVIEYGAAETGVVAMSGQTTRDIRLLWDSYIVSMPAESNDITVTTLASRTFPLINYAIGDRVTPSDVREGNVLAVSAISGRQQDVVRLSSVQGDFEISAILPVHILKSVQGVSAVQFEQTQDAALRIYVRYDGRETVEALRAFFISELSRDYPGLDGSSVSLEFVDQVTLTRAGKHALFRSR